LWDYPSKRCFFSRSTQQEYFVKTRNNHSKKALSQIERLADVRFVYSPNLIQSERKVSLSFENNRLSTVLNEFLTPLHISYEVVGNRIVLSKKRQKLRYQPMLPKNSQT
jgi:hypothetical protein